MKKAELVFIPLPGMGHLVSAIQLAKLLVDFNSNLSITVLIIKPPYGGKVTAYIDSLSAAASTTSRIKFIYLPRSDPDMDMITFMTTLAQTQGPLVKEVVANIVELSKSVPDSPRLAGFVLDMFLTSFIDLANEFGVPSYAFHTSGAAFLGFQFYCTQVLHEEQNIDILELKDSDTEFTIPAFVNPVSTKFFPGAIFNSESVSFFHRTVKGLRGLKGMMVNTFSELESHAVNSLSDGNLQIPQTYPVGPILNFEVSGEAHQNYDAIMQWLDEQPRSSVVFLCFGSMGSFGADQVKEIACALEQSGHRFLWSLRRPGEQVKGKIVAGPTDYENVADVLPEGFLDRTIGIGKVIGWVPQVAILNHPATGGFVSHCGWNSILESIWSGVPIATWPLYSEQQLNAFLLVKELGLAVDIKMDYKRDGDGVEIVKADKIESGIRLLMEQNSDVRERMKNISDKSRKALINARSQSARNVVSRVMSPWKPPIGDVLKVNFDAAFHAHSSFGASGVVIRNSEGLVMAASSIFTPYLASPFAAEATACLHALQLASSMGYSKLEVEGDNLTVIRYMQTEVGARSLIAPIIFSCKDLLWHFSSCTFKHVNKESNVVAHTLAAHRRSLVEDQYWVEDEPLCVERHLLRDRGQ